MAGFCFAAQAFQIGAHIGGVLITRLAIFFECLLDNFVELGRHVRINASGSGRLALQNRIEDHGGRAAGECLARGHHFVQHEAEAEKIRAGIELFPTRLLRRHVGHGADRRTGAGEFERLNASASFVADMPRSLFICFARPKSRTLAWPRSVTKIFAGLTSR